MRWVDHGPLTPPVSSPVDVQPPGHVAAERHDARPSGHRSSRDLVDSPTNYADQWERRDSSGASCVAIPQATSPTYGLTAADVSHTLRVVETASNAGGTGPPAESNPSLLVELPRPPTPKPQCGSRRGHVLVANASADRLSRALAARGSHRLTLNRAIQRTMAHSRRFSLKVVLSSAVRGLLGQGCAQALVGVAWSTLRHARRPGTSRCRRRSEGTCSYCDRRG